MVGTGPAVESTAAGAPAAAPTSVLISFQFIFISFRFLFNQISMLHLFFPQGVVTPSSSV